MIFFFLPELLIWKINREVFCRDYLCKVLSDVLLKGVCKNQVTHSIRHKEICHKESAEELTTVPEKYTLNCSRTQSFVGCMNGSGSFGRCSV